MVQYNNVREKDRIARKGAMLPDGDARLPDGYIICQSYSFQLVAAGLTLSLARGVGWCLTLSLGVYKIPSAMAYIFIS